MKKATIFFSLTAILWAISLIFVIRFVKSISETANENLAKVEAPGSTFFPIETPGTVTLWHNYQDFHSGITVNHEPNLPSGFSFELRELGSSSLVPFVPTRIDSNVSGTQVSKKGLGTFEVAKSGDYELTVNAPAGQSRLFSLSEGTLMGEFGSIFGQAFGAIIPGLLGAVTLILAIIFLATRRKEERPVPSHAA